MRKLLLSFFVLIGCNSASTSLDLEKYDRSCKNANDCVIVATDSCCGCAESAINADAKSQYDSDFANAQKNCGAVDCPAMKCETVTTGCSGGLCVTITPPADAGAD